MTLALGSELLESAKLAAPGEANAKLEEALSSGRAAEHFNRMVAALGGPKDFCTTAAQHLKQAGIVRDVFADTEGMVQYIDTRFLGMAVIEMGGGRRVASDPIDYAVGLSNLMGKTASVDKTTPIARIHANDEAGFNQASKLVRAAYRIGARGLRGPSIIERIGED